MFYIDYGLLCKKEIFLLLKCHFHFYFSGLSVLAVAHLAYTCIH